MSLSKLAQHQTPDLPQLCLLAVISQMTLVDRISALQVCPQWHHRVKETNQATVKSLAIVVSLELTDIEHYLNKKFRNCPPIAGLVTSPPNGLPPLFPLHRLTDWNCLQFADDDHLNSATIDQILSALPWLAELTFSADTFRPFARLVEMLHADRPWRSQLTGLKVISSSKKQTLELYDLTLLKALFDSINGLPALQYLTLKDVPLLTHQLTILAQLKEINIEGGTLYEKGLFTFMISLQQYASINAEKLQVDLFTPSDLNTVLQLQQLSEPLRRCFTCLGSEHLRAMNNQELLDLRLTSFPNLTSVRLFLKAKSITPAFSALAQLPQLAQLSLRISWRYVPQNELPPSPPLRAQLFSVKWLQLTLLPSSHSQLHWLNLPVTVPNVLKISLDIVMCLMCGYRSMFLPPVLNPSSRSCLRTHLRLLMDITDIPSHRIVCFNNGQQVSAEELLAEEQ